MFLAERLKLKVNADKSAVARPWQRKFLGYSMTWHREPKLRIAAPSVAAADGESEGLLRGARGRNLGTTIQTSIRCCAAGRPTSGWPKSRGYWKSGMAGYGISCAVSCGGNGSDRYTRARNLMQRGLTEERAWRSAINGRGPWWNAGASHMHAAFPKSWFDRLGLVSLLDTVQRLQRVS